MDQLRTERAMKYRCKACGRVWKQNEDRTFSPADDTKGGCWGSGETMLEGSMGLLLRVNEMEEVHDDQG